MEFLPLEHYGIRVHAGFWRRLGAGLIDGLVSVPLIPLFSFAYTTSITWLVPALILNTFFYFIYTVFFHYKYGATLGKLAIGIRVTQPDGSKINFEQALLRSSIDLFFAILYTITELIALATIDITYYNSLPKIQDVRASYIDAFLPSGSGFDIILIASQLWIFSEIIVLLFNKRKRAFHDFIAGTVVIKQRFAK